MDHLEGANGIALDPGGDHVYVASERGPGGGDWLAVFSRNPATGELAFVEDFDEEDFGPYTSCTGVGPDNSGIVVRPDGEVVFVTNSFRGTVAWFDRDPVTGELTLADSICDLGFGTDGIAGAVGVTTDPSGEHIYTASSSFETVAALTDAEIFADGFESGDTTAWSSTEP